MRAIQSNTPWVPTHVASLYAISTLSGCCKFLPSGSPRTLSPTITPVTQHGRTAVLAGSLNRGDLHGLRCGTIPVADGAAFDAAQHGLVIDDDSEYEDCAYGARFDPGFCRARVSPIGV